MYGSTSDRLLVRQQASALLPDKDAPVICFCAVGGRAGVAKAALEAAGYTSVVNGGGLADVHALASSLTAEGRLAALGIEFPELAPLGRYVPYRLIGNMLYGATHPHLILTSPHLILTSSSPRPHHILTSSSPPSPHRCRSLWELRPTTCDRQSRG